MHYALNSDNGPLEEQIHSYYKEIASCVDADKETVLIGHRIGDYRKYPVNLNRARFVEKYDSVTDMIDRAFNESGLSGIELDVRLWGKHEQVSVAHDQIRKKYSDEAAAYLEENSFENVLEHFIRKRYYEEHKLYIELKLSRKIFHAKTRRMFADAVNEYESRLIERINSILEEVCRHHSAADKIRESIGFISFSLAALHKMYLVSEVHYPLYLITTTDQFMKKSLSRAMFHIPLTEPQLVKIRYAEWLTGIWFDPYYLDDPAGTFLALNATRKKPLEFFLSTYGMKPANLLKKFRDRPRLPVQGIIFELEP